MYECMNVLMFVCTEICMQDWTVASEYVCAGVEVWMSVYVDMHVHCTQKFLYVYMHVNACTFKYIHIECRLKNMYVYSYV